MQQKRSLVLFLTLALANGAFAASNAPITDVTLYPDSATLTRAIHVTPGMTLIELHDLPATFDKKTVRAKADAGIRVGQVIIDEDIANEAADPRAAELQKKIDELQEKKEELDVQDKSAQMVQHFLEKVSNGSPDRTQPLDTKWLATTIDTVQRNSIRCYEQIQKVNVQKRDIDKQINVLREKMEGSHRTRGRVIRIALDVHQAGILRLSYQNRNASWKPGYRASLNSATGAMEVERVATVKQLTGEEWRGVNLVLSTGHPSLLVDAAEPQTRTVTYLKPQPPESSARNEQSVMAYDMAQNVQRVEVTGSSVFSKYPESREMVNTYATQFTVPSIVNVPSDITEISVDLSKQTINVKQVLRIVPREQAFAVLTVDAAKPDGVWPSGDVQLFRDGDYIGSTYWVTTSSERLQLSFGRDDLVSVKLDRAPQQSATTGLLSPHREQHIADTFTIASAHKTPVDVLVLESSPVSNSEEVTVKSQFEPQPTTSKWDSRAGVVGWETQLPANGKLQIHTNYDISYPKEGSIAGLP